MKEKLIQRLKEIGIISRGNFLLSGGGTSSAYFDIKKAYGYPDILDLICSCMHEKFDKNITCVAATGIGGIPLATSLSQKYNLKLALIRERKKEYGLQNQIDCYIPNQDDLIAIVDDVYTSGKTLEDEIEIIKPTEAEILGCYVVIKRGEDVNLAIPLHYILTSGDLLQEFIQK